MTLTQVMDHYALAFGQQPTPRPHGLYPCGGCGRSFQAGDVCILILPGGGEFLCAQCHVARYGEAT